MKIINIMSSKNLGGVEQAFLDYNEALSYKGHEIFSIYNKNGKIKFKLKKIKNIKYLSFIFFKPYFLLFPFYFIKIRNINADIIIIHSKKVLFLFSIIGKMLKIPIILVTHTEKTKLINKANYIFSITQHQKDIFSSKGFDFHKIFVIPNLITNKQKFQELKTFSKPPIFGIIGRFDPMKGFPTFIEACSILKNKNIPFQIKIAGSPQKQYINEYQKIKDLIEYYGLQNYIEFIGWIENKEEFYNNIDIFVLPSNYEPFGIVLLEAMMYSKPIISSLAEGPSEIFKNSKGALTFDIGNFSELANLMIKMINNLELAKDTAKVGYELVNSRYTLKEVANTIDNSLRSIYFGI